MQTLAAFESGGWGGAGVSTVLSNVHRVFSAQRFRHPSPRPAYQMLKLTGSDSMDLDGLGLYIPDTVGCSVHRAGLGRSEAAESGNHRPHTVDEETGSKNTSHGLKVT